MTACGGTEGEAPLSNADAAVHTDAATHDGGLGIECTTASASFKKDVAPILEGCAGGETCHGGLVRPGSGMGSSAWPYDSLVNVMASRDTCAKAGVLVEPSNLEKSYLMHKLTGVGMCPNTKRMPALGSPLPDKEIQTIADWICQGAKND